MKPVWRNGDEAINCVRVHIYSFQLAFCDLDKQLPQTQYGTVNIITKIWIDMQ